MAFISSPGGRESRQSTIVLTALLVGACSHIEGSITLESGKGLLITLN